MAAFVFLSLGKLLTFDVFTNCFGKFFVLVSLDRILLIHQFFNQIDAIFSTLRINLLILQNGSILWLIVKTQFSVDGFKNAAKTVRNSPFLQNIGVLKTRFESLWNEFVVTCHSVFLMRNSIFFRLSRNYYTKLWETRLFLKVQLV